MNHLRPIRTFHAEVIPIVPNLFQSLFWILFPVQALSLACDLEARCDLTGELFRDWNDLDMRVTTSTAYTPNFPNNRDGAV